MTDGVAALEINVSIGEQAKVDKPSFSRKDIGDRATEFRGLTRENNSGFDKDLREIKKSRLRKLQEEADFGLYEPGISDERLKTIVSKIETVRRVREKLDKNPEDAAGRYRGLGKKSSAGSISKDEFKEFEAMEYCETRGEFSSRP